MSQTPEQVLVVFTRFPEPGRTKTRLIPALGADGAAALQRQMTESVLSRVLPLVASDVRIEIRGTGAERVDFQKWLGRRWSFRFQGEGDLGARMARAIAENFAAGAKRVVVIGSDCPGLNSKFVGRAFAALHSHDAVFGPARDGGYYLVGLSRPAPKLFTRVAWSTDQVLAQSEAIATRAGLRSSRLIELSDVDEPADLSIWESARAETASVSVIIPTLNDAAELAPTLTGVRSAAVHEIIVADAGSTDGSPDLAAKAGARVISTTRGRGHQMNSAAAVATGENLLFLHADTRPPAEFPKLIAESLRRPGIAAGAFRFALREPFRGRRLVETLTRWRSARWQRPYGDQGLFLRREMFEAIEGFPEWPLLEDVEITRRLRRVGRIITLEAPASTSARRWQRLGVIRTFGRNQFILLAHALRAQRAWLAQVYDSRRTE